MLKPLDILVVLKILASGKDSFESLGKSVGISASQAHTASKRAIAAGILRDDMSIRHNALLEALFAAKYYFPARRGDLVRGIPTAYAAKPLIDHVQQSDEPPPVWPHPEGKVRGVACSPLYKTAPEAALGDAKLYEFLALIDALRIGRVREVTLAKTELQKRLSGPE